MNNQYEDIDWFDEDIDWFDTYIETKREEQKWHEEQVAPNGDWHHYPEEVPDMYHCHCLCKLAGGEYRELWFDEMWGWCAEWDELDRPHFVYDFDCEWMPIEDDEEE